MIRFEYRPSVLDYKETYVGLAPLPSASDTLSSRILSIPLSKIPLLDLTRLARVGPAALVRNGAARVRWGTE